MLAFGTLLLRRGIGLGATFRELARENPRVVCRGQKTVQNIQIVVPPLGGSAHKARALRPSFNRE